MREPKDLTILVVDDEESLRSAIVFDFKKRGFKVREASGGREALAVIKATPIDVVLSDVRMPEGDGLLLLDQAKELNPDLPIVILITGFADITSEEAYHRGADAIFSKPFDRKLLIGTVMQALATKEEIWSLRKTERIPSDLGGEVNALGGRVHDLGRGGFFVALPANVPPVGTRVTFKIEVPGISAPVEGEGIVRWNRVQHTAESPSGCGIEFEHLADEGRRAVIALLANVKGLKGKPFIPKK